MSDKPASIDALEDNIEAFVREIPAEITELPELTIMTFEKRLNQQS